MQAGLESAMGIILGALSGINLITAPGMLEFESCQSLEKLVIDNEICGMAYRLINGVNCQSEALKGVELLKKEGHKANFLSSGHTVEWFRKEQYIPSKIIDRTTRQSYKEDVRNIFERAKEEVHSILSKHKPEPIPVEKSQELTRIMEINAKKWGMKRLPI